MSNFREEVVDIIKNNNYKIIVEVGVWKGELSRMIASLDIEQLYMVDPLSVVYNNFYYSDTKYQCTMGEGLKTQEELDSIAESLREIPKSKLIRKASTDAAKDFEDKSVDLVFIDAIHLYQAVKDDIEAWLPKIKKGGIICGDDYVPRDNAVSRAVDEIFPRWERVWQIKKFT